MNVHNTKHSLATHLSIEVISPKGGQLRRGSTWGSKVTRGNTIPSSTLIPMKRGQLYAVPPKSSGGASRHIYVSLKCLDIWISRSLRCRFSLRLQQHLRSLQLFEFIQSGPRSLPFLCCCVVCYVLLILARQARPEFYEGRHYSSASKMSSHYSKRCFLSASVV